MDFLHGLEHIGIAVEDIDRSLQLYRDILGFSVEKEETLPEMGIKVAMLPIGDTEIELIQGITQESTIYQFVQKKGEGIHHLAFTVDDLEGKLQELKEKGIRLIDEVPRRGVEGKAIAFLHPSATGGTLIELVEG